MTLATWLTLLRLALAPALVAAFMAPPSRQTLYASGVLAVAGLTDILDGYLARTRREESLAGRLLDPVADKLIIITGVLRLVSLGRLRPWIAWALLVKEVLLVLGAMWFYRERRDMLTATWLGKTAAVLFYAGLFLSILAPRAARIGEAVVLVALLFSMAAGMNYARRAVSSVKGGAR